MTVLDDVSIGTELPALPIPPISRTTLALFAGASGDTNPTHGPFVPFAASATSATFDSARSQSTGTSLSPSRTIGTSRRSARLSHLYSNRPTSQMK